jgi:hypothetical protein
MTRYGILGLASLLLGTSCAPPSTSSSTPAPLQAGQTIPVSFSQDGKEVYRATMVVRNLEDPAVRGKNAQGVETDLVALLEKEDFVDPEYAKERGKAVPPVSFEEVVAFLDQHWDAEFGDKDDPGRNATEFMEVLADMEVDPAVFIAEFKKLGLSLSDYLKLVSYLDGYDDLLGGSGFTELIQSLDPYGLTLKDFLLYLQESEVTTLQFFAGLIGKQQTIGNFLLESAQQERTLQESLQALVSPSTQADLWWWGDLKLVFDKNLRILEDGKPTGYKTRISNLKHGGKYEGGQVVKSGKRSLTIGSPATPLAYAEWEVSCRYGATPWSPVGENRGKYLEDIKVEFTKAESILGWKLNGRLVTKTLTHTGTPEAPEIETLQHVRILANLFESSGYIITDPYYMRATSGFAKPGDVEWKFHFEPFSTMTALMNLP